MILLICGILKNDTNELIYKTEIESHSRKTYGYQGERGGRGEGINCEIGIDIYTLYKIGN